MLSKSSVSHPTTPIFVNSLLTIYYLNSPGISLPVVLRSMINTCKRKSNNVLATVSPHRSNSNSTPSLDEILSGQTSYEPWRRETFLNFLQTEMNDENFFFFEEIEAFKAMIGQSKAKSPPENLLLLPSSVRTDEKVYASTLVDTFVKEGAEHQVNISADQRIAIIESISKGGKNEVILFEEAQKEIESESIFNNEN